MNEHKKLMGASVLTTLAASLCCITPIFSLLAGTTGVASTFTWITPYRPYLIGFTVLLLAFAWYQKFKPKTQAEMECACNDEKPKFINSKRFLLLTTLFTGVMLAFPSYYPIFSAKPAASQQIVNGATLNVQEIQVTVEGMTCTGCEAHIESEVNKLEGILNVKADYAAANTIVKYDTTKVDPEKIETAILSTGYKIIR
ncbi:mercuric transport protein MerTP [Maribacter aestuarii]|uniref:mercuric transport protein MerTP n=1 Tax=Maribacter aestuarii TaxID=1130723 RepID=UPI00248C1149|nr:mercuric transport protein MerTP [Maribacter aestuarii]